MTIAIHQPNYLPWLGFFYKIYAADEFVFLDDVQYSRRSFTSRTLLPIRQNLYTQSYLSVPLRYPQYFDKINNVELNQTQEWRRKHLATIRHTYAHSPFFKLYYSQIEAWVSASISINHLSNFNIYLINQILELIGIDRPRHISSQLPVFGQKADYIIALVKYLGGKTYLSGEGAKNYQSRQDFQQSNINLVYSTFGQWLTEHPYPQYSKIEFYGKYSIIDSLFNIGSEGILEMFSQFNMYDNKR